ncbi:hypothetical protein BOSEA31B_11186 [Hyphomicrobiales bacterium]|nr:hypothetical protein BOSEA31B_11186 [Hyphomicrobiales bacterium]CAH1696978.1 hypothetical protein BOSEA1005_10015 [Hyphomicrobiales bacterium]CAI0344916.1 hypothetical protein BO1005MUT1_350283 [Hyphomicrobiales bacterium]
MDDRPDHPREWRLYDEVSLLPDRRPACEAPVVVRSNDALLDNIGKRFAGWGRFREGRHRGREQEVGTSLCRRGRS